MKYRYVEWLNDIYTQNMKGILQEKLVYKSMDKHMWCIQYRHIWYIQENDVHGDTINMERKSIIHSYVYIWKINTSRLHTELRYRYI